LALYRPLEDRRVKGPGASGLGATEGGGGDGVKHEGRMEIGGGPGGAEEDEGLDDYSIKYPVWAGRCRDG